MLFDDGIITNSTALPVTELKFGGLSLESQFAFHTLGKLSCSGKKAVEPKATSCSSLKLDCIFKNGYYNIKEVGQHSKLVFCDMDHPGNTEVPQESIESSEEHFDQLEENINLIEENIDQIEEHINQSEESMIVFSAYVKTDHYYGNGDGINGFDEFLANYGNTFYLASGIFTTPKSGMYEFSFVMCHDWKYSAIIQVWKNDVNGLAFYSGSETSTSNHDTLSATWLITLKKSDTIQLKAVGPSGTNIISCGSFSNCVFNGKYIRSI